MAKCNICKRELDVPGQPESDDCGGDCTQCMADCYDPDAMRKLGYRPACGHDDCIDCDLVKN